MQAHAPLLIGLYRGGLVESLHQADAVVWQMGRGLRESWGDARKPVFPRSSIKMLQALPLARLALENGVSLAPERLALACASHWGQPDHVSIVRAWLADLEVEESCLRCGAHLPFSDTSAAMLMAGGLQAGKVHNNCSGKHVGVLQACLLSGDSTEGYHRIEHPCQRRIHEVLVRFAALTGSLSEWGIDGCGIPAWRMPLESVAAAMARFASPDEAVGDFTDACAIVFKAMVEHPVLIGGTDDYSSRMTAMSEGKWVVKVGAEGFMTAAVPAQGVGVAIKVLDGAERAAEAAMSFVLARLGLIPKESDPSVVPWPVRNWAGEEVGSLRVHMRGDGGGIHVGGT